MSIEEYFHFNTCEKKTLKKLVELFSYLGAKYGCTINSDDVMPSRQTISKNITNKAEIVKGL